MCECECECAKNWYSSLPRKKNKNFLVGFSFCPFGFSYYVPLAHPSPNNKCDAPAGATGCQPTAEFTPPGKIPPNAHNWGEKQHEPGSQG